MTDNVWERLPAEIAPKRIEFEIRVLPPEEPEPVVADAADEYGLSRAREAAQTYFVERSLQGPHAAGWADVQQWPPRYREAFEDELERLQRERDAELRRRAENSSG